MNRRFDSNGVAQNAEIPLKTIMNTLKKFAPTSLLAAAVAFGVTTSQAADVIKADNANNLTDNGAWVGGVAPTASDVATWNDTVQANTTSALGANASWAGIKLLDPAGAITISSGNVLTLGASGVDLSAATTNLTLQNSNILGSAQTWNVAGGLVLTASGGISGASTASLTKIGNGTLVVSGGSTYSGGTLNAGGVLQTSGGTSLGTGPITNTDGTTFRINTTTTLANAFVFNGNVTVDLNNVGGNEGIGSPGAISGSGYVTFVNQNTGNRTFTLGGSSSSLANFSGTMDLSTNTGTFRFNDGGGSGNTGSSSATINLGTGSVTFFTRNRGAAVNMGALFGGPNTKITQGSSSSGISTYTIGAKNIPCEFDGTISDTSTSAGVAITKTGSSILVLTGPNVNVGQTTVSGGILQVGLTNGTSGQLGSGAIVDNATLVFSRADAISLPNTISGSGNFVQAGSGTISFTASSSTFSGQMIVTNDGTIQVGAAGSLSPAASVTLGGGGTGGTLDLAGNNAQINALNTGAGATSSTVGSTGGSVPTILTVNATNGTSTFGGVIRDTLPAGGGGTLALVVENGKLTLTGVNTYTGSTTISNGTLVIGAGGSIAASPTIVLATAASFLDASASGLNLPSGYNLSGGGGIAGSATAANSFISPGTNGTVGTLSFSNNLALTGGVTVHFDLSAIPTSGNDQVLVTGALNLSGLNTIEISPLTGLSVGTYKLFVANSVSGSTGNLQLSGSAGSGLAAALNVTGTEVDLVVTATGSPLVWTGDGTANQWDYTTANWSSNSAPTLFKDASFTVFNNSGSHSPMVDITAPVSPASVTVDSTANYTFGSVGGSGKISGIASVIKTNTGTLILLTPNDYVGGTFISQGTLQVGNGLVSGTALGNGDVVDNASLLFNQPDNYDFTNVVSGSGTLTQSGTGTLTLSGNNTYSGTTLISTGTLQVGDGNTSGTLGTNVVINSSALAFNRSDLVVQAGRMTGTGVVSVLSGTVAVTASNDLTGLITINPGTTLQLGNGGPNGSIVLTNLANNGTLAFNHSIDETNSASLSGAGGVAQVGTNVLTFAAANTYNGDTTIANGTLKLGAAGVLPTGIGFGNVVLNGGATSAGTLDINGLNTVLNGINGNSNAVPGRIVNNTGAVTNVLTVGTGDASSTYRGLIANNSGTGGAIALVKTGSGTFTVGWTNSYTGGTVISNGILALGSSQANNSGGLSGVGPTNAPVVFMGGTLQLFGYNGSTSPNYNSFYNPLVVPAGQTGTLQLFSRGPASGNPGIGSSLTGSGTLNLVVNYVRDSVDGDWSAFTGLINVSSKNGSGDEFRINNKFGYANASIFLNDGVLMDRASGANPTNDIGELGGTSGALIGPGNSSSASPTWRVGWKNTSATFAGTIQDDGHSSIVKVGTGTWFLAGQNAFTGSTIVSNGVLALTNIGVGDGALNGSTNIFINAGAVLDVSGRGDDTLYLNSGQVLSGNGTLNGIADTTTGGTISAGNGIVGAIGMLTVTNHINMGGTTWMKLNRAASPNSDRLVSPAINLGGTLVVTNISGTTLHVGDTFTLFNGPLTGSFTTLMLPNYYTWDTAQLTVNGTIRVTSYSPPVMTTDFSTFSSGTITFNASNGLPGGPVQVLTSANLAAPLSSWTVVTSGNFDGSGLFSSQVAVDTNGPTHFYIISAQ